MTNHATRVLHFAVTGALLAGGSAGCPSKSGPYTNTGRMTPPSDEDTANPDATEGDTPPPVEAPVEAPVDAPVADPSIGEPGTMNMRKVEDPASTPEQR